MIVFGGLGGLEEVVETDHSLPVEPDQVIQQLGVGVSYG